MTSRQTWLLAWMARLCSCDIKSWTCKIKRFRKIHVFQDKEWIQLLMGTMRLCSCNRKNEICENKSFRKNYVLWRNIIGISFTMNLFTSMHERRDCAPVMKKLQFVKFCILTVRLELWFCFVLYFFSGLTKWSSLKLQSSPLSSKAPPPLPKPEGVGAVTLFAQLEGEGEKPLQWKEEVHPKCKKMYFGCEIGALFFYVLYFFFLWTQPVIKSWVSSEAAP